MTVLPPFVFFAWSQEHLKVFAYVPLLNRFVVPLGYRSVFALGADALYPDPNFLDHLVPFAKRYIFWLVATMAVSAAWIVARARSGDATQIQLPIPARFIGALALYTLLWQGGILWRYPTSVPGWATTFAPLWAVVLAYGATILLRPRIAPVSVRRVLAGVLGVVFAASPSFSRHPSMPLVPPQFTASRSLAFDAATIQSVVPPSTRVFLVGSPLPAYVARVSPYPQQLISPALLVPSDDVYSVSRSGVWGRRDIESWLARDAAYAIVAPAALSGWRRGGKAYAALAQRIELLLDHHFTPVASFPDRGGGPPCIIYRRIGMEQLSVPRVDASVK